MLADLDGTAPVGETPPTIAFDDQGSVSGTGGCNTFNGEVTIDGSDLTFGPLATTQMFCAEEGVADQEQAFLTALQDVTSYTVDDEGRLVLAGRRHAHVRGRRRGRVAGHPSERIPVPLV